MRLGTGGYRQLMKSIFLDTNIYMHCLPADQIDWEEVVSDDQDEARFGLKSWHRRRWCPFGVRPPWVVQDKYEKEPLAAGSIRILGEARCCPGSICFSSQDQNCTPRLLGYAAIA